MGVENDITEKELKRKIGPPTQKKPLFEFSDTMIRQKLDETFDFLVKKSSELDAPFDKLVAKCCMRYFFTSGKNFDKKKGQMFNEVHWLHLDSFISCYIFIFFSSTKSNNCYFCPGYFFFKFH
jgi:hypothetical protein